MDRQDIKLILRCPYKDIIEYLLNTVNLTDKEIKLLNDAGIKVEDKEYLQEDFKTMEHKIIEHISNVLLFLSWLFFIYWFLLSK